MTVKDYLKVHNGEDIKSVGIYKAHVTQGSDIIDAHVKTVDLIKYEDMEVDHVHVWVYDEQYTDINGNPTSLPHIRACIYVK